MKSEEYYMYRDLILVKVDMVCEAMDNDSVDNINRITIDIMFELNKWRKKNSLPLLTSLK